MELVVPKLEFYITNVCNLDCQGCNRFNDIHFRGWQRWSDYESIMRSWADHIDIEKIVILGGEPLLNPTIVDWIKGLHSIWRRPLQVLSNGTRIHRVPGLYDALKSTQSCLTVSLHDMNLEQEIYQNIREFFQESNQPVTEQVLSDRPMDRVRTFRDGWEEGNFVMVDVYRQTHFSTPPLRTSSAGRLTLHQSDPNNAFQHCSFAKWKNYHMIRGAISRCGPAALFPELDDQHDLDLSPPDKNLIREYRPLQEHEWETRGMEFFQNIDQIIPQCKFCPSDVTYKELVFQRPKKIISDLI